MGVAGREALRRAGDVALHAAENATVEGANDRPVEVSGQAPGMEEGTRYPAVMDALKGQLDGTSETCEAPVTTASGPETSPEPPEPMAAADGRAAVNPSGDWFTVLNPFSLA